MKNLIKIFGTVLIGICFLSIANAQTVKTDKRAAKSAEIKRIVTGMNYIFAATYATPLRSTGKSLTGPYNVTISKDNVVIYLPYYGRAYSAPIDAGEGGIKLTTTHFDYNAEENKKGGWEIVIKPKEKGLAGIKDVQQLRLTINNDGYANLQVTCLNRDAISFNGYIEEQKKKNNHTVT